MNPKFSRVVFAFFRWAAKTLKPQTVAVYRHYFLKFIEAVGDRRVRSLRPAHLSGWATTWHQAQAVKRLFNWALNEAQMKIPHPFSRVKQPPKGQRRRICSDHERAKIFRASRADLRALLFAYAETFSRPGELRAACFEDLKTIGDRVELGAALGEGRAVIVLHEFKDRSRRKDATSVRVILLSPRVGRLIRRLLKRTPSRRGPIFRTAAGKAWTANALRCRLRRLRRSLGLKRDKRGENIVPYTFRHTGATAAAAAGIRDRLLADVLGHTETKTTARYQHLAIEHLREAMLKLWTPPDRRSVEVKISLPAAA